METTPRPDVAPESDDGESEDHRARATELGLDETLPAGAWGATIRPPLDARANAVPGAPVGAVPPELPTLSILLSGGAPAAAAAAAAPGADLLVLDAIGAGAMGRVLLARQQSLQRDVAIKTIQAGASAVTAAALLHEGMITGQLEHPSIVPLHALVLDRASGAGAGDQAHPGRSPWSTLATKTSRKPDLGLTGDKSAPRNRVWPSAPPRIPETAFCEGPVAIYPLQVPRASL